MIVCESLNNARKQSFVLASHLQSRFKKMFLFLASILLTASSLEWEISFSSTNGQETAPLLDLPVNLVEGTTFPNIQFFGGDIENAAMTYAMQNKVEPLKAAINIVSKLLRDNLSETVIDTYGPAKEFLFFVPNVLASQNKEDKKNTPFWSNTSPNKFSAVFCKQNDADNAACYERVLVELNFLREKRCYFCNVLVATAPLSNSMVGLWSTPILKRTLNSDQTINEALAKTILAGYEIFKSEWNGSRSSTSKNGVNDLFFAHQQLSYAENKKLWPPLQNSKIIEGLIGAIKDLSIKYLAYADPDHDTSIKANTLEIYMWAGIHEGCVSHLAHYHPHSAISGTYYVSVPENSGELILSDPRGLLPPFGGRHIHTPKAGEVILFPSWLRHEVSPSCSVKSPRIALSFNVIGKMSVTNDATSLFFDLETESKKEL